MVYVLVCALDSRSGGRWFEPGLYRRVVSLTKKLYSSLTLFIRVYKWVLAIITLGVTLCWTSIPLWRSNNIRSQFMLQKGGEGDGV